MIYRFGQFELDDATRELRDGGGPVDTEPKAFELLLYLLNHRDRAVSKDELLEQLWPRTIVTETALTRCVMKARRAVGDDSDTQSVIRTLHGHGYRFVAELAAEPAAPERPQRRSLRGPLAGLAAVIALVILLASFWPGAQTARDQGMLAVLPVANLVEDAELRWVRVGMMSLLNRMLEDGGVELVSDRAVIRAVGDAALLTPPDDALTSRIRELTDASSVLHTTLDLKGGLYRLSIVIMQPDGRRLRRIIVGDSPVTLAADMAKVLVPVFSGAPTHPPGRFAKASSDPFVNEAYARALDLELQGQLEDARQLFRIAAEQEPELFWLRYEIALCTRDLREWDEAVAMFEALREEALAGADVRALIVTLNSHGILLLNRYDYAGAEALFLQALDAAIESPHASDRASIHTNLALVHTRLGNVEAARADYEAALQSFAEAGETPAPSFNNNYAGLLLQTDDLATAEHYSLRAIDGFRLQGQRRFEAPALNRLAKILRRQGDFEAALARHEQALAIYRELQNEVGEVGVLSDIAIVYREQGELQQAAAIIADVIARALQIDDALLLADAYMQSGYVAAAREDYERALADFETARETFAELQDDAGLRAAESAIAAVGAALGPR